jgi:hypothetical protein
MADDTNEIALQALRLAVHRDPALQSRLFALTDAKEFIAAVRQLAQSHGHALAEEDVSQAMYAGRRVWSERRQP